MFDNNFDITGKDANYLKDLCELRGNVADKDSHNNFKIFKSYVDAYVLCPLIGYQYGRKGKMGSPLEGNAGILAEQIINRSKELQFVYQILMLVDEDSEPNVDNRIKRAFAFSEETEEEKREIEKNMNIFNEYFLGGVEVMHEQFVDECIDRDDYLYRIYEFTKQFYEEQDGEVLRANIDKFLNN